MSRTATTARPPLRDRLGAGMRRANHLVAAGVLVFAASILLGALLARPFGAVVGWSTRHLGRTGLLLVGPLVTDGSKAILLLAAAFPMGRILLMRPWVGAASLLVLVYGLWFAFEYVVGAVPLLYGRWEPLVGRGLFALLVLAGVARLMGWGRRVALETDARRLAGSRPDAAPPPEADAPASETGETPCKPDAAADVEGGSA